MEASKEVDMVDLGVPSPHAGSMHEAATQLDGLCALADWLPASTLRALLASTDDLSNVIQRTIADIDHRINEQLNAIIHHQRFQALEASWRGLWYLVVQAEGARSIKLKMLDIRWSEVARDIGRALEFDQSQLFHKVYSEEYGTPGGEPYGVLIGDYEVSHRSSRKHSTDDIATLEGMAQIAAAAFAPFIVSASPELFGLEEFSTLAQPLDLSLIFSQQEYLRWNTFRSKPDARFVGITLPRILMRLPYRKTPGSYKGVFFHEHCMTGGRDSYCWGHAVYAFAAILIREFATAAWFGHIRGVARNHLGGGLLANLPCDTFDTDTAQIAHKPLSDVVITDTKERELSDLGFIPLCQCYDTPFAAFYSNQSAHRPSRDYTTDRDDNARISAMLQHVLCASRVAHYIKVIIRDRIGSFATAGECENHLREWLFRYTTGREDLDWKEQARYPLREAAVHVKEHPEKPGSFHCTVHLRPHYQLDHMVSEIELATELVQTA